MKKVLFALVCMTVILSSCGGDNAVKVNDAIVDGVDGTVNTVGKVLEYINEDDYANATLYLDSVKLQVPQHEEKISKLQNKSAEEFKQASLDYLKLIRTEAVDVLGKVIELYKTGNAGQENQDNAKIEEGNKLLDEFSKKAEKQENVVHETQKAFAKANDITLVY